MQGSRLWFFFVFAFFFSNCHAKEKINDSFFFVSNNIDHDSSIYFRFGSCDCSLFLCFVVWGQYFCFVIVSIYENKTNKKKKNKKNNQKKARHCQKQKRNLLVKKVVSKRGRKRSIKLYTLAEE